MCCFSVSFTRLLLVVLVAIIQSSRSKPYGFQGAVSFAWDDSTGSGIGEIEEPITTLKDSNGQESWVQISSNKWGDFEKPLPEAERVLLRVAREGPRCNFDKHCDNAKFCHEHYKYCEKKKYVGEKCRRTENCLSGAICMWGQCHKENKPGFFRSRCKRHIDCSKGLCCAREHGESICKPYLTEGQNCSVSTGGFSYSFQHDCPCGYGLVCKSVGRIHHGRWEPERMKCTKLVM